MVGKEDKTFLEDLTSKKWDRLEYRLKRLEDNCIEPSELTSY
jgi:hypothetical protein